MDSLGCFGIRNSDKFILHFNQVCFQIYGMAPPYQRQRAEESSLASLQSPGHQNLLTSAAWITGSGVSQCRRWGKASPAPWLSSKQQWRALLRVWTRRRWWSLPGTSGSVPGPAGTLVAPPLRGAWKGFWETWIGWRSNLPLILDEKHLRKFRFCENKHPCCANYFYHSFWKTL